MNRTTTSTASAVISSDDVEGTKVCNTVGDKLGLIDDLMIDKVSGQVRCAVLEFGGFLGMGTDRYPLPCNMLKYDTTKEGCVVPLDKDRLDGAPRYASEQRPDYDDAYGRRVASTTTTACPTFKRRASVWNACRPSKIGFRPGGAPAAGTG